MRFLFTVLVLFFFAKNSYSQVNSFVNSSFENYSSCVTSHSQFGNVVFGWNNILANNIATTDFFTDGNSCSFKSYSSLTNTVSLASGTASKGCSWVGIYLNYYDTASINTKYREYIGQKVSLISGKTYTVKVDLARSNHNSSKNLEVDFAIYGYNGSLPAGQLDYCLLNGNGSPATVLGTVSRSGIGTAFQTFQVTFTPSQNFDYLVLGGANCGVNATAIGYVFIDNVQLSASDNSIVNPVIERSSSTNGLCGLHCLKQSFDLVGNVPQAGTTITWSQSPSNPEQVTFTTPNAPTTTITGTGSFITGMYEFYYTFSNGTTTVTDTAFMPISEYKIVNTFTAGPDINYCNGNPDSTGQLRGIQIIGAKPGTLDMLAYNAKGWWSMIRNDGTEWRFPNGCNPGDGADEGDVYAINHVGMTCNTIIPFSTNSSQPGFFFRNPQDTVQFIWHIEAADACNSPVLLVDTLKVIYNDIDFQSSTTLFPYQSVCVGKTMVVTQAHNNPNVLPLQNKPNLTFLWSYTPQNGGLSIVDNTVSDSAQLVGLTVGDYIVRVRVFDAASGCSWYDIVDVNVSDCGISAGPDTIIGCDPNFFSNDSPDENYGLVSKSVVRRLNMNAIPSDITLQDNNMGSWWSMIRNDGSEWVFPNGCVPYNGFDEGDVFSVNASRPCGHPSYGFPSSSFALFNFRNAIDSVTFIWHVIVYDPLAGTSDTLVDTVEVQMRDVDFPYSSYSNPEAPWRTTCNDTLLIHQHIAPSFRPLGREENLVFRWDIVEPSGLGLAAIQTPDAHIVDNTVSDSALLVTSAGKLYRIMLTVTDTVTGCSWLDFVVVKRIMPIAVDAGSDSFECVQNTGDYEYQTNASIWYEGVNSDTITRMSTWWSTIRDDGTEWVFPNKCVPSDGANEGNVYILNLPTNLCNSFPNSGESNAMDCIFRFSFPGKRTLIWNALDNCTGEVVSDTVIIGYGVLDQADAGPDLTATCNVVTLEGNLSSLSSANSGYYFWEQLTGPDTVQILNSSANIAYFSTANLTAGVYQFKYTLGLFPCQTSDTVEITVVAIPNLIVDMTSNYDQSRTYCHTDTIQFNATGGQQYAFLVDGVIVQPFSPIGTFSYAHFTGVNEVTVLGMTGINGCVETLDSALVITVLFLTPPVISQSPNAVCEGEQVRFSLPAQPNGTYTWFGPNGPMNNDSTFQINYVSSIDDGTYSISYAENNCFSDTTQFNLTVYPTFTSNQTFFACASDSILFEGIYYTQSINFEDSLQSAFGCDSIITTQLVIGDTIVNYLEICSSDSVFLAGGYQNTSGVYIDSYPVNSTCDSIIKTELAVLPRYLIVVDSVICYGESIYFGNAYQTTSGVYTNSLLSSLGCDSTFQLNLTVLPLNKTVFSSTICSGDSLLIFNQYQQQAGVYTELLTTSLGCDSIIEYQLVIQNEQIIPIELHICDGDSLLLENSYQVNAGIYTDTLTTTFGCDSIVKTTLFVHQNYARYDTVIACGNYFWNTNATSYTTSGNYTTALNTQFGCDSIVNLNLVILPIEQSALTLPFFCDSAFVNEKWYYYSQVVTDTLTAQSGCDSLVYIELDIRDCSVTANFSDLYIPNVFTPNNDGVNDAFIITSFGELIEEGATLLIYNRWGVKLFESNKLMKWTGDNYSDGTYYYIFNYKGEAFTGHINLIRNEK